MEKSNRLAFVYLIIGVAFLIGWPFVQNWIRKPKKEPAKAKPEEMMGFVLGSPATVALGPDVDVFGKIELERKQQLPNALGALSGSPAAAAYLAGVLDLVDAERQKQQRIKSAGPSTLIEMGKGKNPYHLQVLLNTRGGAVQQVVLTDFQQADREGLGVYKPDGTPRPLHLIPGVRVKRTDKLRDQRDVPVPELKAGKVKLDPAEVEHPSYVMYHYLNDPDSRFKPVDTLGVRELARCPQ